MSDIKNMKALLEAVPKGKFPVIVIFDQFQRNCILPNSFIEKIGAKSSWEFHEDYFMLRKNPDLDPKTTHLTIGSRCFSYSAVRGVIFYQSLLINIIETKKEFFERYDEFLREMDEIYELVT